MNKCAVRGRRSTGAVSGASAASQTAGAFHGPSSLFFLVWDVDLVDIADATDAAMVDDHSSTRERTHAVALVDDLSVAVDLANLATTVDDDVAQ